MHRNLTHWLLTASLVPESEGSQINTAITHILHIIYLFVYLLLLIPSGGPDSLVSTYSGADNVVPSIAGFGMAVAQNVAAWMEPLGECPLD